MVYGAGVSPVPRRSGPPARVGRGNRPGTWRGAEQDFATRLNVVRRSLKPSEVTRASECPPPHVAHMHQLRQHREVQNFHSGKNRRGGEDEDEDESLLAGRCGLFWLAPSHSRARLSPRARLRTARAATRAARVQTVLPNENGIGTSICEPSVREG